MTRLQLSGRYRRVRRLAAIAAGVLALSAAVTAADPPAAGQPTDPAAARASADGPAADFPLTVPSAARQPAEPSPDRSGAADTGYRWPLDGQPRVGRPFDPPARRWLPGHRGVDLVATPGAVVRAAGAGVVSFSGSVAGVGVVSVGHPGGLRTTYQPVTPLVATGEAVAAGAPIGVLVTGHPGCPTPTCLHWGLRWGEFYLDPLSLVGHGRVRLLPRPAGG